MAFNYLSVKVTYYKFCLKKIATFTLTPLHEKDNTLNGNVSLLTKISPRLKVELELFLRNIDVQLTAQCRFSESNHVHTYSSQDLKSYLNHKVIL